MSGLTIWPSPANGGQLRVCDVGTISKTVRGDFVLESDDPGEGEFGSERDDQFRRYTAFPCFSSVSHLYPFIQ